MKDSLKIGILCSITGAFGPTGIDLRDAAMVEVDLINASGGVNGRPIELIIEDDGSDPKIAVPALKKLINEHKVLSVLGPGSSVVGPSTRLVSEEAGMIHFLPHPSTPELRAKKLKWSFNLAPNDLVASDAIIEALKFKGFKKVIAVVDGMPAWYRAMLEKITEDGAKIGIQVLQILDPEGTRDKDPLPQFMQLKELAEKEKPDAVILLKHPIAASPMLKVMKMNGWDLPVIGGHSMAAYSLFVLAGSAADGVIVPGSTNLEPESLPDGDPQKKVILDFSERFTKVFYRDLRFGMGSLAHDYIHMMANAIKVAGDDRGKIRDAIEGMKDFVGIGGIYNFSPDDHDGLTKKSMAIYQIDGYQFTLLKTIE